LAALARPILYPLVFLGGLECALLGLNPSFYIDDSPEFVTVAATLGVAHPPGYPLYMLLGRILACLSLPVCFSVNFLSAFFAALICLLLFDLLNREYQMPVFLSLAIAFLWLGGLSAYPSALSAKRGIYELAGLFELALIVLLLKGRLGPAAFLYGLSLGGHWMTMAVYGPGLALLGFLAFRKGKGDKRVLTQVGAFFLLGSSVYLYLPLRAVLEPAINWGYPARLNLFLDHLTRHMVKGRDYTGDAGQWVEALGSYAQLALAEFKGLGLLALAGLFLEWKKNRERFWGPALSWAGLIAGVSVFSHFSGKRLPLLEDYSVSAWPLLALFTGLGLWGILGFWKKGNAVIALGPVLFVLSLMGLGSRVAQNGQTHYTADYDYVLNSWKPLPKGAFFFCEGDQLQFPAWYFQWVEGKRRDLCIMGSAFSMDWNRIRMAKDHPGVKVPAANHGQGGVYDFSPLFPVMIDNNPGRRFYFSFPPKQEGLSDLRVTPLGLAQEAARAPLEPSFDGVDNDNFWRGARMRHLGYRPSSYDLRTWNTVLEDYGAKRLSSALYEMNRAVTCEAASKPNEAAEWYRRSLGDLSPLRDWDPAGYESVFDQGGTGKPLPPGLTADVAFHRNALIAMAIAHFHLGDMEEARRWIQLATGELPGGADVLFYAGLVAFQGGNYPEAQKWLQKALGLDPNQAQAAHLLQYMSRKPESLL